uniref:Uncharacterized protein n=1 Tax=Cucumis melo TaxID=3656 RepID=A0A9I9ELX1_CUCME
MGSMDLLLQCVNGSWKNLYVVLETSSSFQCPDLLGGKRHGKGQPEWFRTSSQQPLPSTVLSKRQETFQTVQRLLIGATVVFAATTGIPCAVQIHIFFLPVLHSQASAWLRLAINFDIVPIQFYFRTNDCRVAPSFSGSSLITKTLLPSCALLVRMCSKVRLSAIAQCRVDNGHALIFVQFGGE